MKGLLLTLMFFISMAAFSQQESSREDGATVLKDSSIVAAKDSLMSSQSIIIDHQALAKKYKSKSTYYGIAAAVSGWQLLAVISILLIMFYLRVVREQELLVLSVWGQLLVVPLQQLYINTRQENNLNYQ